MFHKVKNVKPLDNYKILITFEDDTAKFVELVDTNKYDAKVNMVDINVKFSTPSPNVATKLLDIIKRNPKDVKKVSVSTDTETTDLLKKIFTREATIELSEDDKVNLDRICKLLQTELLKIIHT